MQATLVCLQKAIFVLQSNHFINMNKRNILIIFLLSICTPFMISWGVTGHRAIGLIAENHLTPKTKAVVQSLLGGQSMADVATWADEVRSQPDYRHTGPWHYINLPLGLSYDEFKAKVEGMTEENVYSAIHQCEHTLTDASASFQQRSEALKFIIHFVGDLHQPMHVSRAEDKGGNTIQLNYNGQGTNLHAVWDSRLLDQQGQTYQEIAQTYDKATPAEISEWQKDPLIRWMWESYEITSKLYPEVDAMSSRSVGDDYYKAHIGIVDRRIEQAGIRLAGLLNGLLENMAPVQGGATVAAATDTTTSFCDVVSGSKVLDNGMTLLNLGGDYPNQKMTVVIKAADRDKFSVAPEVAYKDKKICVKGTPTEYKGKPEIIVTDPSQITIQ